MIVSFGTCDLKLYTVKFLLFVCSFRSSRTLVSFFFFATACTYCFRKGKDIVNVSVEGYVRKEQREEKARRVREGIELLTSEVRFKALSQDGKKKTKRGSTKTLTKKKREEKKKRNLGRNQNQKMWRWTKGGIIYSLLAFFCLYVVFSLKKNHKKKKTKQRKKKLLLLTIPGCVQVLLMFLEFKSPAPPTENKVHFFSFSFVHGYCITV